MPASNERSSFPEHPFRNILTTRFKVRVIRDLLRGEKTGTVLDAGCGSGFMLSQLHSLYDRGEGIDMSPEAIAFGQQFTKAKLAVGNAEKLSFGEGTFDAVISTDAIEHIVDDLTSLKEARRVLKPGGTLVVYTPSKVGLFSNTPLAEYYHDSETSYLLDQRYYTVDSLRELAEKANFKIEYLGFHSIFLQEACTQLLKWVARKRGYRYEHQADISNFLNSPIFPVYRWLFLPIVSVFIRLEELIFEGIFRGRVRGHRIVMKCRKVA